MAEALDIAELWENCLTIIKFNTKQDEFKTYFEPIVFESYNADSHELNLRVPTRYFYEILDSQFKRLIYAVVWKMFDSKEVRLVYHYTVDSENNIDTTSEGHADTASEQKVNKRTKAVEPTKGNDLDPRLNELYTFENYISGESNALLCTVGMSIADNNKLHSSFNPFFVHGGPGVGKTHLIQAIAARYKRKRPEKRVLYISANEFKLGYMDAKRNNDITKFITFFQSIDMLIIDDIHEFAGLEGTLSVFFDIFNHLYLNGKRIIMSCDRPPATLKGVEERLISRFTAGFVHELLMPDQEMCKRILLHKVHSEDLNISEDVIDYLSHQMSDSVREGEGYLQSLMAYSVCLNRNIDLQLARQIVGQTQRAQHRQITIEEILQKTCAYFDIAEADVMSKSRKAPVVQVRQLTMFLAQKYTKMTMSKIGLYIGQRNHATVIHSVNQIKDALSTDREFAQRVAELERQFKK